MSELIDKIQDSYKLKRLIPFIGAGFSKNIEGYPSWSGFIQSLEESIGLEIGFFKKNFGNDYLEATEYWILKKIENDPTFNGYPENKRFKKGKDKLRDAIRDTFRTIEFDYSDDKWQLHNKLVNAPHINQIFTTNWDHALEIACDNQPEVDYHKIIFDNNFNELSSKKAESDLNGTKCIQIIKYHGDYEEAESIIACETDYYKRMTGFNSLDIKFKNEILYHDFLFIGYSFNDINVKYVLFQMEVLLKQIAPEFRPRIFYITTESINQARNEFLKKRKGVNTYYLFDILEEEFVSNPTSNIKISFREKKVIIENNDSEIYANEAFPSFNIIMELERNHSISDLSQYLNYFRSELIKKSYLELFEQIFI